MSRMHKKPEKIRVDADELDRATALLSVSGSFLYGLNHAESDEDFYRVVWDSEFSRVTGIYADGRKRQSVQIINKDRDEVVVSFNTFVQDAREGSAQALEAMFSDQVIVDRIGAFRHGYRANTVAVLETFGRAAKRHAYSEKAKRRHHALRLLLMIHESFVNGGRFSPRLSPKMAAEIRSLANADADVFLKALRRYDIYQQLGFLDKDLIRALFEVK